MCKPNIDEEGVIEHYHVMRVKLDGKEEIAHKPNMKLFSLCDAESHLRVFQRREDDRGNGVQHYIAHHSLGTLPTPDIETW